MNIRRCDYCGMDIDIDIEPEHFSVKKPFYECVVEEREQLPPEWYNYPEEVENEDRMRSKELKKQERIPEHYRSLKRIRGRM